jgi:hypothetical protein
LAPCNFNHLALTLEHKKAGLKAGFFITLNYSFNY